MDVPTITTRPTPVAAAVVWAEHAALAREPLGQLREVGAVAREAGEAQHRRLHRKPVAVVAVIEREPVLGADRSLAVSRHERG